MPAEMARRMMGCDPKTVRLNHCEIGKFNVGHKARVDPFAAAQTALGRKRLHDPTATGIRRAKRTNLCARGLCQRGCAARMVAVGMGDENGGDISGPDCAEEGRAMGRVIGAGIDDHHLIVPDQIAVCAPIGHRSGIGRHDPIDPRHHRFCPAGSRYFCFPVHRPELSIMAMTFQWVNRYLPRSLYGRAAVILLVPVISIQLVVSLAFIQRHYEGVARQMTENLMLELSVGLAHIEAADGPFDAADRISEFAAPLALATTLPAASPVEDAHRLFDFSGRAVIDTLHNGLPGVVAVDLATDADNLLVLINTDMGPLGLTVPRERVTASEPHQLLILMLVASGLMTIVAYFFLWNQLLPLRNMAEAAEAFGRGQNTKFKPEGATELRQAGAAFLEMRNRIERHIEQRTLMLSGVSHDIRTPLTRMRLGLSLLPEGPERDDLERDVADMEGMLDAFLSFARGEGTAPPEPADPEAMAKRVVEKARRGGTEVSLGDMPADPIGEISIRRMAVERALDNLVSNGVRYGDRVTLSVAATQKAVRFRVEDNGPGIPPANRDEALRPFTRLDPSRNQDRGPGVGLGLSIAADIARQHGGTLRLGDSRRLGGLAVDLVIAR